MYNSDNASILLEAEGMQRGNLLLQRWFMPTDSFLTGEIPLYALGLLLGFSMPALLHIVPALLYTLLVLTSGYLAFTLFQEKQRVWSVLALLAIVAFPALDMAQGLLIGPMHLGTVLYVLLGLIAYRGFLHSENKGRWAAFAILLLITVLAVLGDPFALVFFVVPLVLNEIIGVCVKKRITSTETCILVGMLLANLLAFGLRTLLNSAAGVHILLTAGFSFTNVPGMVRNFQYAIVSLLVLFHANILAGNAFSLSALPLYLNALVLLILIYAVVRWFVRSFLKTLTVNEKIVNMLIWSLIGLMAAFILNTLETAIRYLFPMLFIVGIIGFIVSAPFIKRRVLIVATLLVLVINGSLFTITLVQAPTAPVPEAQLMTLLKEHHLARGLGTYWVAPIVTVQSEERIVMRQIVVKDRQIHPYVFLADKQWFDAAHIHNANFIVYRNVTESDPWKFEPREVYDASVRSFGVPDQQYRVGTYTVLVWNTPLLTHMQPGSTF